MEPNIFACSDLEGKVINGWKVTKKLAKPDPKKNESGGTFSICYEVEKDGIEAFMKVLDYGLAFMKNQRFGVPLSHALQQATEEFNYEQELSKYCNGKHLANVVHFIEGDEAQLDGYMFGSVSYIIYEKADGDIKKVIDFSANIDFTAKVHSLVQKIKSLHAVSKGLNQLHTSGISHQDLKPSNILSFNGESKIGDLGRSLCLNGDVHCPYQLIFNGDKNYAAPEFFYKHPIFNSTYYLYQIDNYMLGGLICFYITNMTFNALMNNYLPADLQMHLDQKNIPLENVFPDLTNAFQKALIDFGNEIPLPEVKEDLVQIVGYLCQPDPSRRGHPAVVNSLEQNYSLTRTITKLDTILSKTKIALTKK